MSAVEIDNRSPERRDADERIASERKLPAPDLTGRTAPQPIEAHLAAVVGARRPVAVAGVVENGMVRPLDPAVKLPEHARVIIVASSGS